ncbi:MAG: hypothetical protein FWF85_07025 [Clostridiales bacterium]|jgi:X-X-X-Leu-X-X-Gly heptad repeat protein|nr:hypothetical protein [Clostridiales bacterium]MDR2713014.1 hypothetical protein [Clostridiales bacterium]
MKTGKKIIASLLILIISMAIAPIIAGSSAENKPLLADSPAAVKSKTEVVYARLGENGDVRDIYVVNDFSLLSGGILTDYGNYTSLLNLTDLQPIDLTQGMITVPVSSESFYYQGYLAAHDLPWLYDIEYSLNGTVIRPSSLAGKSGELEIRLKSSPNRMIKDTFYHNYMQQITITLDNDKCADIKAEGATAASAGKNRILVFTVLAKQDADIIVRAKVADFEMAGIEITAMPLSLNIEMPDLDDMLDDFTLLTDAVSDLNDGAAKLKEGTAEMASGSRELKSGSADFKGGLAGLSASSGQISSASGQIRNALAEIASSLNGTDLNAIGGATDLAGLAMLPEALGQLADGLDQVAAGMRQLNEGYGQAYAAIDRAIGAIPGHQISEAQIYGLSAKADPAEQALLAQLMESYIAAMTVKGVYEEAQTAFSSVEVTMTTLAGSVDSVNEALNDISRQIGSALSGNEMMAQIKQLSEGMLELSQNYAGFHNGLGQYLKGILDLAGGYSGLDRGIAGLNDGVAEVFDGIAELSKGTAELTDETSDLPDRLKNEFDDLKSKYTGAGFAAVSFTSAKNSNTDFVQFVLKTENIEIPKPEKSALPEAEKLSFWERLIGLFRK